MKRKCRICPIGKYSKERLTWEQRMEHCQTCHKTRNHNHCGKCGDVIPRNMFSCGCDIKSVTLEEFMNAPSPNVRAPEALIPPLKQETEYPGWRRNVAILGGDPSL